MSKQWKKVDSKIFISETTLSYVCDWNNKPISTKITLRIDGREGSYRFDLYEPFMGIWEAKDGGKGFATVREAEIFASSWKSAVVCQGTLSPSINHKGERQ